MNNDETGYATYEQLSPPQRILVGRTGFVEVVHMRANLKDGTTRDFIRINRGYVTKSGDSRTDRFVTIPANAGPAVARILAPGGIELGIEYEEA